MAKAYRLTVTTRVVNWVFRTMTEFGLGAPYRHVLIVTGRRTGLSHSTPVDVMDYEGRLWLVAGYGPANWVNNARAAPELVLRRGRKSDTFTARDAEQAEALPVLRKYMAEIRVTRRYFDANADSPDDAIAAELRRHPVLRLDPVTVSGAKPPEV